MKALQSHLISTADDWTAAGIDVEKLPVHLEPTSVLMCEPKFFEVKDSKNPFMEGNLNGVDTALAAQQWQQLKQTFERLGYPVKTVEPAAGLEDMVFTANQVLPGVDANGRKYVILAEMAHQSRRREVPHFADWFKRAGYQVMTLGSGDAGPRFEGQGDAIWHPGRRLIWGGYGYRTQKDAYNRIAELTGAPVALLQLIDPLFYHLDTAFCALNEESVLIYPGAFAAESLDLIRKGFRKVIEVSHADARNFACNAVALGKHVVLQKGSADCCQKLRAAGFEPVEVDTSEFMKSGGSVFCLKMQVY